MCERSALDFFLKIFSNFFNSLTFSLFLSFSLSLCARLRLAQGSAEQFEITVQRIHMMSMLSQFSFSHHRQTRSAKRGRKRKALILCERFRRRSLSLSEVILMHRTRACRIGSDIASDHGAREFRQYLKIRLYFCHHCQSANS